MVHPGTSGPHPFDSERRHEPRGAGLPDARGAAVDALGVADLEVPALAADGPGRGASHSEIATWAGEQHGLAGGWAHGVAVGVRRLTGQRVPGQMADGSFAVSKTATLSADESDLRAALLDEATRAALLPGLDVTLRSKPTSKALRLALADGSGPLGSILFTLATAGDGRCRVTVSHERLTSAADGERWKTFWAGWLAVVAGALRT